MYIIKNFKFFSFASKKLKGQPTGWEMLFSVKVRKMGNLLEAGYHTHVSNLSTWEGEAGWLLQVQDQLGLYMEQPNLWCETLFKTLKSKGQRDGLLAKGTYCASMVMSLSPGICTQVEYAHSSYVHVYIIISKYFFKNPKRNRCIPELWALQATPVAPTLGGLSEEDCKFKGILG